MQLALIGAFVFCHRDWDHLQTLKVLVAQLADLADGDQITLLAGPQMATTSSGLIQRLVHELADLSIETQVRDFPALERRQDDLSAALGRRLPPHSIGSVARGLTKAARQRSIAVITGMDLMRSLAEHFQQPLAPFGRAEIAVLELPASAPKAP